MKLSPRSPSCIILCTIICLVLVSGCTVPPKTDDTPPPLIPDVQTTVSLAWSESAPGSGCAEGQTPCSGVCSNIFTDAGNCGRCGNVCSASQYCSNGVCTAGTLHVPVTGITTAAPAGGLTTVSGLSCPTGFTPCNGICRNLEFDTGNCGRCGNVCGSGRTCSSGACSGGSTTTAVTTVPAPLPDSAAAVTTTTTPWLACPPGTTRCGGTCSNHNTDNENCGGCGNWCSGGRSCVGGVCSCPAGNVWGGSSCINLNTDPHHCGAYARACGSGIACCNGACKNLQTDTSNCGSCGSSCWGGASCCSGACIQIMQDDNTNCGACGNVCPTGSACCNGICNTFASDNNNCGSCHNACPAGQYCSAGTCVEDIPWVVVTTEPPACGKGMTSCSSGKSGSVCTDLNTDDYNCGSCGHVCTGGTLCSGGICGFVIK